MKDAAFWDRMAERYSRQPIANMTAYEETLDRVRRHLRPDHRAIELGCGTGSTALLLAPSVARYTGTDYSSEMIRIAEAKRAASPVPGLDFAVSDAGAKGFEREAYDAVLAFNLYHLVRDIPAALRDAGALLKPGGLLITKTACIARKWHLRPFIRAMQLVGKAPYVAYLTEDGYDAMIRDAGFEILEAAILPKPSRFVIARKL